MTRLTTASNLKETDKSNNNLSSNVQVVVRVRPLNEKESQSSKSIIKVVDDRMLTFDPKEELLDCLMSSNKNRNSILDKKQKDINYVFDFVFGETSSNRHVFENTTKEIIEDILKGYNCSVFAYGATSAGKTHTMLGSAEEPGVIFLTMMELYKRLMEKEEQFETDISVSYLEIYNETCKDLLLPTGPLSVREDPNKKVVVNGLSLHKPRSPEELLDMLHFGNQNRSQHPTDANKQSSRSHAVFQVFVKQCPKDAGLKTNVIYAKISLIDLAGSERATVTTNRGDRLREGANINKSLLALGNCINALAENKSNVHIPYRNSKLTRLLKDSLGGNCKTVMIAAVSPSSLSHEDTHNTLKYANRAKNIKSTLHTNTISVDFHVSQYAQIVKDLQAQIGFLNEKLSKYEQSENESSITEEDFSTLKNFEEKLSVLYGEKRQFKQNLIDIEAMEKVLKLKLLQKERSYERFSIVQKSLNNNIEENDPMVGSSFAKLRQTTSLNLSKLEEQKKMLDSALMLNQEKIRNLHSSVDSWANSKSNMIRAYVNLLYNDKASELEKVYLACQVKQMRKYFSMVEAERENGYSLAEELCAIIRISSASGNYHSDEIAELLARHKQRNLLSTSKVVWADDDTDQKKSAENLDMTNLLQFQCVTPFRTPSRRPSSLRQAVLSARKTEGTSQEREMLTKQNTLRNAGPVRDMRTCLKKRTQSAADAGLDEKNATFTRSRSFSSTDQSPYGEKTFAYPSNTQSKRRIEFDQFRDRNKNENVEQVVARDDDCFINQNDIDTLDSTYLVGASLKQLSTENKNSVERINKSQIPMRAPLKTKNRETTPLSRVTNYRSKYLEDSPLDKTYQVSDQRQESLVVRNIPVRGKPALSMKENFPVIRNVKNKKSRELLRYSIGPSKYFR